MAESCLPYSGKGSTMGFYPGGLRLFLALGILCSTIFSFYGCTQLGPRSISRGRASYNEAITQTDNEQLLMSIVRGRYGETYNMLAITAVAANIRFSANANAQVGIGPSENYIGNLVPLSSGVAYEENPTITYAPAQGAVFLRQLHSPVPLETLVLLVRTSRNPGGLFTMMVETINGIRGCQHHVAIQYRRCSGTARPHPDSSRKPLD